MTTPSIPTYCQLPKLTVNMSQLNEYLSGKKVFIPNFFPKQKTSGKIGGKKFLEEK